jgi:flavin-dependent dehydrogenase
MIDVLVAGGGPVGLATAICCARAGLSVTVAEPRAAPIDKACGEGVMPAALRRLATLGVDPLGFPLRGIRYLDASHHADAVFRHGSGRGVRRTTLHAALADRTAALGIAVLPVRVTSFTQHPGHVSAGGVEARYLVAADGLHSPIRRMLAEPRADGARANGARADSMRADGAAGAGRSRPGPGSAATGGSSGHAPEADDARRPGQARHGTPPRYGLRQHFRVAPWTDFVEVYWTPQAEAYVTPVASDLVGIGLLFARPIPLAASSAGGGGASGEFGARLAAFPALRDRLGGAAAASDVRGAGPMRQDVRRRVYGRVLLVGDASGYVDALTGEGIGVGLAQAEALAGCLAAGRPGDYERAWRRVSGPAWRFTAGLLWSRNQPLLANRLVIAAQHFPWLFTALVNHAAEA